MYQNLQTAMKKEGITNREIGAYLNLHENTIGNKLSGKTPWYLEEAIKIKERFFPSYELQFLFKNIN